MSAALRVYLFQRAVSYMHALTLYRSGNNVTSGDCPEQWVYRGRLLLTRQSLGTLPIDADSAMSALQQHGVYMLRLWSGIIMLPP
jgi:hypothetical protein